MGTIKKRLDKIFKNADFEALLLMNTGEADSNFRYISNLTSGMFEDSILVAFPDKVRLLTSPLEYGDAMREKESIMEVTQATSQYYGERIPTILEKLLRGKTVGINGSFLPYANYLNLKKAMKAKKIKDASTALLNARSIKDNEEIRLMKKAVGMTKKAFEGIGAYLEAGVTETYIAGKFNMLMSERGASDLAFKTIVAFGKNAALPHHSPDGTRLKANEFVLIDAGAKYMNYCADMTRTVVFRPDTRGGKYRRMEEMVEVVRTAHDESVKLMADGAKAAEIHAFAEDYINKFANGRYKGRFIHSLGHSIGIDVHDGLRMGNASKVVLKTGMVFSDEPGVYVPGFGGVRIEDDVLIGRKNGTFF